MATVKSFAPVSAPDAQVLILGSMPGRFSLARQEYYAHPQNFFWRFMGELFGAGPEKNYQDRLEILLNHRVALWDVLRQCNRVSSMDSDIEPESLQVNDFATFLTEHSRISHVFFNGTLADKIFRENVLSGMQNSCKLELIKLPSTSPANASVSYQEKLLRWQAVRTVSF